MRKYTGLFLTFLTLSLAASLPVAPLSYKALYNDRDVEYQRGIYLIMVTTNSVADFMEYPLGGNFVEFKRSQGYDVDFMILEDLGLLESDADEIKDQLEIYSDEHPMLEYLLIVGDKNGTYEIPCFYIQSINEPEMDVTDYPYTYFDDNPGSDNYDVLSPRFIVGRWPIQSFSELANVKNRTINYTTLTEIINSNNLDYLNRALLVAGNYANNDGQPIPPSSWPVTPVWTSYWLQGLLQDYGYAQVDTAFFHATYPNEENPLIMNAWDNGVGFVAYRGWGNSQGWHYPRFYLTDIHLLENGWKLPIVFSLVCNTGDFGADDHGGPVSGFAETLLTAGSVTVPKGAAAVIGPSDLDTDTRYNNVIYIGMWDSFLEGRTYEIGAALHVGKQALLTEFPQLAGPDDIDEFYHHVYMVIGDPSMPLWMLEPVNLSTTLDADPTLYQSFISTIVTDEEGAPVDDVVGALMYNGELIAKGLSTPDGHLDIDFSEIPEGAELDLYLNKPLFFQKHLTLTYNSDDGTSFDPVIWTEFDVQAVFSSGESYLPSDASTEISLLVTNNSPYPYMDMTLQVVNNTEGAFLDEFLTAQLSVSEFSNTLTEEVYNGFVAEQPMGSRLELEVQFLQSGTVISESTVQMIVGPVNSTDPVPACDYGYWAFDNTDTSYEQAPEYNWIDIAEVGTDIGLTDDTVVHDIEIGFPFTYFGQTYETVTVCSNGWFSFERQTVPYFWNFSIPMAGGASSMVAPFNDDLDDNGGTEPFNVYVWQDAESSRFILQWDNVANGEDDEFCPVCVRETFQAILYDSAVWETPTGDGEIVFQYSEIHDLDENGNYSTIGIESPDQNDGVQYLFNNQLAPGAAQLADGLAIKFTTSGPQSGCFKGDVNLDGIPDILDIVMMISVILNDVPVLTPEQFCAADMIEDGILDILDIVNLVSVILE